MRRVGYVIIAVVSALWTVFAVLMTVTLVLVGDMEPMSRKSRVGHLAFWATSALAGMAVVYLSSGAIRRARARKRGQLVHGFPVVPRPVE
jgi:hypothetical protein